MERWTKRNMKVTEGRKKERKKERMRQTKKQRKKDKLKPLNTLGTVCCHTNEFPVCSDVTNDMLSLMTSSGPEVDCSL